MSNTFWLGIQPAIGEEELTFVAKTLKEYLELKKEFSIGLDELFITAKGNKIYGAIFIC